MMNGKPVAALERHAAGGAGGHDARHRAQPLDAVAHHLLDAFGLQEPRPGQRHPHRQHVVRVEAGIDAAERDRRADQQRRADEQDERERHFGDHEQRARLVLPEAGAGTARALLERRR